MVKWLPECEADKRHDSGMRKHSAGENLEDCRQTIITMIGTNKTHISY